MRSFLAAVLSVIAVGVMLIAYGLFTSRTTAAAGYPGARPMFASERVGLVDDGYTQYPPSAQYPAYATPYAARPVAYPVNEVRQLPPAYETAPAPRRVASASRPSERAATVERRSGRDWQKTAMVVGGTTAAGAGLGAIFGGKKGALIGAAIGGGAGTLYEVKKR
jgi:hypothetical protein